jgi:hypothetical protein
MENVGFRNFELRISVYWYKVFIVPCCLHLRLHPILVLWSWKGRAIPLLPLWAVRPVQSLSACTRVHFTFTFTLIFWSVLNHKPECASLQLWWCWNIWGVSKGAGGGGRAEEFLLTWGQHLGLFRLYVHVSFLHLLWSCLLTIECLQLYCPDSSAIHDTSEKLFSSWRCKQFARGTLYGYTSPSVNSWWSVLVDWMGLQIREPCETTGHGLNKSVKFSQSRYLRLS